MIPINAFEIIRNDEQQADINSNEEELISFKENIVLPALVMILIRIYLCFSRKKSVMTNTELQESPGRQLWLHVAMPAFTSKKAYYDHYILLGCSYLQWMTLL